MSCHFGPSGCSSSAHPDCSAWGVLPPGRSICMYHFDYLLKWMKGTSTLNDSYLEDCVRIYILMENQLRFLD